MKKKTRPKKKTGFALDSGKNLQRKSFRRWLITRLQETTWVFYQGEKIEDLAASLGITTEVLLEAEKEAKQAARSGSIFTNLKSTAPRKSQSDLMQRLAMPAQVKADFTAYAKSLNISPCMLLRSVMHHVLSRPPNPTRTRLLEFEKKWIYGGREHTIFLDPKKGGKKWLYGVTTTVTRGAKTALRLRAKNLGVSISAVLREAVIDLLEGKLLKIQIIVGAEMWNDHNRYWLATPK